MTPEATSLARRVSIIGATALAVVLLVVSGSVSILLTKVATERVVSWVGDKTQSLVGSMNAMDASAEIFVVKAYGSFRQEFGPGVKLDPATGEMRDWGPKFNENYTQVDKFSSSSGAVAAIFAAKDGDFLRISNSMKNPKGERAIGTLLGKQNPAFATVSAGKPWTGRAELFGKPYMTHYEPIKSEEGALIGLFFVAFDIDTIDAATQRMAADAKFFERGGTYIVSSPEAGPLRFIAHPTAKGKPVSEVAPKFAELLAKLGEDKNGYASDSPDMLGGGASDYFAVGRKDPESGNWVIAQVSRSEAMASHWATLVPFWIMLGLTTIGLGFGLRWMMGRWVAAPLASLTQAISAIAQGDLTRAVNSERNDEIGALIQQTEAMRQRLADTIGTVRNSVDSIGTASAEIATGNQDLSHRTEQTASNLQVAASSMTELTGTVRQTADSARTANQLVCSASAAAAKGGAVVGQVVATMDDINTSSRKINDIVGVIDGIAFQTNILALNAAVEAARAGEQGRGFAVVASEVRSLAQRSAAAAKEIKSLIAASVERMDAGTRLVQDAGSSMNEIVVSVQRVHDVIGEITAAASEQSEGIGLVSQSVGQLDQMTQQNAALVEQSAAAAESLKEQAHRLVKAVAVFQLAGLSGRPVAAVPVAVAVAVAVAAPQRVTAPTARATIKTKAAARTSSDAAKPPAVRPLPSRSSPVREPALAGAADDEWASF
ncbi:methyl-accepting chemotaxis protein [soil metagenome]